MSRVGGRRHLRVFINFISQVIRTPETDIWVLMSLGLFDTQDISYAIKSRKRDIVDVLR